MAVHTIYKKRLTKPLAKSYLVLRMKTRLVPKLTILSLKVQFWRQPQIATSKIGAMVTSALWIAISVPARIKYLYGLQVAFF